MVNEERDWLESELNADWQASLKVIKVSKDFTMEIPA